MEPPTAEGGSLTRRSISFTVERVWWRMPRWSRWATGLSVAFLLLFLRRPGLLLAPSFFNEDGQVFYLGTYFGNPLESLLRPYAGFLHLVPRLVGFLERGVPVATAPLVADATALLLTAAVAAYLASDRLSGVIPERRLRWAIAALLLLLPQSHESLGSIAYAQWYLSLFLVAGAFANPTATARGTVAELTVLVAAGLSGPFAIITLPLYLIRALVLRAPGASLRCAVVAIVALIQVATLLGSANSVGSGTPGLADLITAIGLRGIITPFFGAVWASVLVESGVPALVVGLVAVLIGGLLATATLGLPLRTRFAFLYLVAAFTVAGVIRIWGLFEVIRSPGVAERYFLIPGFLLAGMTLVVLIRGRDAPRAASAVLIAILTVGVVGDLRVPDRPTYDWDRTSACIGGPLPCLVPVEPPQFFTIHWPGPAGPYEQGPFNLPSGGG